MTTLISWNVNGIRAAQRKGFLDWLHTTQPDVLALQETKAWPEQLDAELREPEGYFSYWASAEKKGYSGVAIYTKQQPHAVTIGLNKPEFDREGRTVTAEYDEYFVVATYVPSGSRSHERVAYKMQYAAAFLAYVDGLAQQKPVVFCGDINVAHQPIDLARPKQNKKTSGFLPIERAWVDEIVAAGFIDTFRALHPDEGERYSWWSYRMNLRARNVGWRLDYFFMSQQLLPQLSAADIHHDVLGSDHCPVSITLS